MSGRRAWKKGDRSNLPERPDQCCAQLRPVPLSSSTRLRVLAVAVFWTSLAYSQDTVHVAGSGSSGGYTTFKGQVADYTGSGLVLDTANGGRRTFPADRILRIDTYHTQARLDADGLFDKGQFAPAAALYQQAQKEEKRPWMRRQIMAQLVWCHRATGQLQIAGREFRSVIWEDANSPYLSSIPLTWIASQPPGTLEQAAKSWLNLEKEPAMVLLGASHLLSTSAQAVALDRLERLAVTAEPPVNQLALAQTWRVSVVTADARQLAAWEDTIRRMPEPLRAGPYYVLGLGRARQNDWEEAALALMRVPILYRRHHVLAARSLLDAGQSLEKLDRRSQAARLYNEVLGDFAQTPSAAEARVRSEGLRTED